MSLKDVMVAVHAEKHLAAKKGKGKPQASKRDRAKSGGIPKSRADGVTKGGGY